MNGCDFLIILLIGITLSCTYICIDRLEVSVRLTKLRIFIKKINTLIHSFKKVKNIIIFLLSVLIHISSLLDGLMSSIRDALHIHTYLAFIANQ